MAPTVPDPTVAYPTTSNDYMALSGGPAIVLIVAATLGGLALIGASCFYLVREIKVILPPAPPPATGPPEDIHSSTLEIDFSRSTSGISSILVSVYG